MKDDKHRDSENVSDTTLAGVILTSGTQWTVHVDLPMVILQTHMAW